MTAERTVAAAPDPRVVTEIVSFVRGRDKYFGPDLLEVLTEINVAVIGARHAAEILYTGQKRNAEEIPSLGLCARTTGPGEWSRITESSGEPLAAPSPSAAAAVRTSLRGELAASLQQIVAAGRSGQERPMPKPDFREGIRAARDHREPQFTGQIQTARTGEAQ